MWEGWKAGFLAFPAFHTLSFPLASFENAYPKITTRARLREQEPLVRDADLNEAAGAADTA